MSRVFIREDFMKYKSAEYVSNLRKDFPMSLADPSYFVPSSGDVKSNHSDNSGAFDVAANTENQRVDFRLATLRKPGLDVTEVSKIVGEIQTDTSHLVSNETEKVNASAAEKAFKDQSALAETIRSVVSEHTTSKGSQSEL